jgi:hypothetical protein
MTDATFMVFSIDARIVCAYRWFAIIASFLPMYVWWRTNRDQACARNSPIVRRIRGYGLLATSSILIVSASCFSIEMLTFIIVLGAMNFAINAYALRQRSSTPNNKTPVHVLGGNRIAFRPVSLFDSLWRKNDH